MALIKVLIIFVVILALLNKRLPLYLAMIFDSLLMIVMFRLPIATAGQTALHTITGWDVWSVNLAMYVISVLVYELDLRHRFEDAQRAMNGLMRDPRFNTSLACMFIGLMQGPATVTICGGMVDTMAGEHLKNDEKAAVATYLRHIPEAMVPTFTGVIVACSISGISISSFFVWMLPMALLTLLAIYLVYLRRVPRTVGETGRSKKECVRLLLRSLWSLLLAIAVIIVFSLPTWAVVAAIAAVNALVEKFSAQEVRDALVKGFDLKSLLGIMMTYVFKDLLILGGVIDVLPTYFEHLPIPAFLVLVILYAFGTLVAGSSAAAAGLHHEPERRRVFAGAADERQLRLESAEPHAHLHGDHLGLFRRHILRHGQKAPAAVFAHRSHRLRLLHAADGGILKKTNKACAKRHRP